MGVYLFCEQIERELETRSLRALFRAMVTLNRFTQGTFRLNLGKMLFGAIHRRIGRTLRLFVSGGSTFDPKVIRFFSDIGFFSKRVSFLPSDSQAVPTVDRLLDPATILRLRGKGFRAPASIHGAPIDE